MLVVIHRHSALTYSYITSCTELLTHFLENQKSSHPSNVLALYSFNPPEPKCITQNKTQRSQINFDNEPNLAPEPRSGQPCSTESTLLVKYTPVFNARILQNSNCLGYLQAATPNLLALFKRSKCSPSNT